MPSPGGELRTSHSPLISAFIQLLALCEMFSEVWQHHSAAPALQRTGANTDLNMEEFTFSFLKVGFLSHTHRRHFPARVVMFVKTPPISLTSSVLCVEPSGRTKSRSACAGLWRPSFFCPLFIIYVHTSIVIRCQGNPAHKTLPLTRTQGGKAYFHRCR